jgi:hypothetical protein
LSPDVLLALVNLTGTVSDIQDDPDTPDANWLLYDVWDKDTECRVSFPSPSGNLTIGAGLQEFKIWVRKRPANAVDPSIRIELYENGGTLATVLPDTAVSSTTGALYSGTWNANLLSNPDGSGVECYLFGTAAKGGSSDRCTVEIGAVEWNVDYVSGVVHEGAGQSDGTSITTAASYVDHVGAVQSDGTSTVTATGRADYAGAVQSDGASTTSAAAYADYAAAALADGLSTATATGCADCVGATEAAGASTATATGRVDYAGAAQSDGASTATAIAYADYVGAALADGLSSATATGCADCAGIAQSDGGTVVAGNAAVDYAGATQSSGIAAVTGDGIIGEEILGAGQSHGMCTVVGAGYVEVPPACQIDGCASVSANSCLEGECITIVCRMYGDAAHLFEDLTAANANGVVVALLTYSSPTITWMQPLPLKWCDTAGIRMINITGIE